MSAAKNSSTLLHDALAEAVRMHPERKAVGCGSDALDYAAIHQLAARLAAGLQSQGVTRGDRVLIWMPKSPATIAAWFATLQAGAAYVPTDYSTPLARLAAIVQASEPRLVVIPPGKAVPTEEWAQSVKWVSLDELAACDTPVRTVDIASTDDAWVHFTSGSTGQPKGAAITHRAAVEYIETCVGILRAGAEPADLSVVANHAPLSFDLASFDVHVAVRLGATLEMMSEMMALAPGSVLEFFDKARPSVLYTVPTTLNRLAALRSLGTMTFPSLRALIFAGERPDVPSLRRLRAVFPSATFHHWYGSTEAPLVSTVAYPPEAEMPDPLPLGDLVPNVQIALLDDNGGIQPVLPGERGELLISGTALFRGYCNNQAETAAAFLAAPTPWYRSRDNVAIDASGQLFHHGRTDHVVKVSGMRVDPGEVEAAVARYPGIQSCAVLPIPDGELGNRLFALYVGDCDPLGVGDHLRKALPRYMVPSRCFRIASIPFTASGKIDRRALRQSLDAMLAAQPK